MRATLLCGLLLLVVAMAACDDGSGEENKKPEETNCPPEKPHDFDGLCVQCLGDDHCSQDQHCNLETGNCACPGDRPHFKDGLCLACIENKHCPDGWGCDQQVSECVELTCTQELPHLFGGLCVECINNGHCKGELICRVATHTCGCADPADFIVDGQCVDCIKSTDCPLGQYCKNNSCVGERQVSNCPEDRPYNQGGECWECLEDVHCLDGETCHPEKLYCIPPALVCEGETPHRYLGECVQCLDNSHCPKDKICNKSKHICEDTPVSPGDCNYIGTGKTVGSQIGNFGAPGCDGQMVNLHDYCGKAKAVWLIAVAGWCGGCDQWAPQANGLYEELKGSGLQLIFILGEDAAGNVPSSAYCQQWKSSHQVTAPVMCDGHWAGLDSKLQPSGYDLPWDYLMDGDNMIFTWESVNFSAEALMSEINKLLKD